MLRVQTLGGLSVVQNEGGSASSVQPRRLAVLALVARAGRRGITRDRVLALLWPDADEETGRKAVSQSLYTLRRDLAEDALFDGVQELRLNAEVATCDVVEFETACSGGDLERAAELYEGPFLDGFRVAGAAEFERWADEERTVLAHRSAKVLEQLARQTSEQGEATKAVEWWRRLATQDPLNSRIAVELMHALAATGDRTSALQHARIYEALMEQQLELPADLEVLALADQLRRESPRVHAAEPATVVVAAASRAPALDEVVAQATTAQAAGPLSVAAGPMSVAPATRWTRWRQVAAVALVLLVVSVAVYAVRDTRAAGRSTLRDAGAADAVLAVGYVADHTGGENVAPALADMLATSLARTDGLLVISTPRLYGLMQGRQQPEDFATAALLAGAGMLVEASVYRTAVGSLRLDLRRVDLRSGTLLGAHTVEAADLFALADAGTRTLLDALGVHAPDGSVGGVTTRSVAAYRLYEQGLRAFTQGNLPAARPLLDASLVEDSTFAMAAFYGALAAIPDRDGYERRIERALRLASHATDRERLVIRLNWAYHASSPALYALADSLMTRYPMEVEGHLYLGRALEHRGEYLAAVPHLQRAVAMDSVTVRQGGIPCHGCAALSSLIYTYTGADSLDAAVRVARQWVELQPLGNDAWWRLGEVLLMAGAGDEAVRAGSRAIDLDPGRPHGWLFSVFRGIRSAEFDAADAQLRSQLATSAAEQREYARWMLAISLRNQGRLAESLAEARRARATQTPNTAGAAVHPIATAEAQAHYEAGRWRSAAALFDSIGRWPRTDDSLAARHKAWFGLHVSASLAAAGDAGSLQIRVDSIEAWGRRSSFGRDVRLHHHIRGLMLAHQGHDDRAVESFRRALFSMTTGYSRTNLELARALLRLGRPLEAVTPLQAALRGPLEANSFYATHTELHEVLALAWDAAGAADSAAVHYEWVVRAWQKADPELEARRVSAERRLAELRAGRRD